MSSLNFSHLLAGAVLVAASSMTVSVWAQTAAAPVARGLIVELKPVAASADHMTAQAVSERLTPVARAAGLPEPDASPQLVGDNGYLLRFAAPLQGAALDAAVQSVAADPSVQSVSPDVRMHLMDVMPNDDYFTRTSGGQWYLRTTGDSAGGPAALNTPLAWTVTTGLNGPVVAVVDSGVRFSHPDLAGQFVTGYDFISDVAKGNTGLGRNPDASDPGDWVTTTDLSNPALQGCTTGDLGPSSWHGTFIAGILGAATNNGIGVAGIDWNAKILPVRVSGKCGGWNSDIIDGIRWAAGIAVSGVPSNPTPARIITVSIGSSDGQACPSAYQSAINQVTARGALVVVAAGNERSATLSTPANCAGVLVVGAVRQDGLKAYYSNFGAGVSLMAPGSANLASYNDWIISTSNTGTTYPVSDSYATGAGTSFAAPMAAGVAALMLTVNPNLTPAQLISLLKQSARPFPNKSNYSVCQAGGNSACNCTTQICGAGLLDANAAVQLALNNSSNGSGGNNGNTNGGGNQGGSGSSQGGGGATGWLWGLALWVLAVLALGQQRRLRQAGKQADSGPSRKAGAFSGGL